jgi:hypothetical protein
MDTKRTLKEEQAEVYEIILKNSYAIHPEAKLPQFPWFCQTQNKATKILKKILQEAEYDHKNFAIKAAKLFVHCKAEKEEETITRASLLRESIDIAETLKRISDFSHCTTTAHVHVVKSQSTKGPLNVCINNREECYSIEEGGKVDFGINLSGYMELYFYTEDGIEYKEIEQAKIYFKKLSDNTHYLKAMEMSEVEEEINLKSTGYQVILKIKLKLSKSDRIDVLIEKQIENEHLLNEDNEATELYSDLQTSLFINDLETGFESSYKANRTREKCCDCSIF